MTAKLKAVYSVSELAVMAGLSRQQMRRRLKQQAGIQSRGPRRKIDVPLDAFKTAFPDLWESILTRLALAS